MVVCKKCGHENDLGRIFCLRCGEKLALDEIPSPAQEKKYWSKVRQKELRRQGRSLGQIAWRWAKVVIFVVLVSCLALIFVAPPAPKIQRNNEIGRSAHEKRARLRDAITMGRRQTVEFTQDEINELLPSLDAEPGGGFGTYQARARQLEIGNGHITSFIYGELGLGSAVNLPIVVRLSLRPIPANGTLEFQETGLSVGRLPIPRLLFPAFRYLMNRMEKFWDDESFKDDRVLLGRARSIRAADGKLYIECDGAPAALHP
jgi:hypothetical protein